MTTKQIVNPHAVLSQVLMETDAAGTPQARYVYGLGLIGREDAAGNYQTYHYDMRGSTTALTNEQGQVTDTYTYDTYGERLSHEGASTQPFQYNGRDGVQTDTNGLYQMRARYYNPEIKRFVNRDVLSGSIDDGLTMNRYAYVNGNPVSYIDPFGLSADGATWWQTGLSFAADATPFVGTIKGIQEVFTGVDLITGEQLSITDRVATGVGTAASWIPFGKHIGKHLTKEGIDGGAWLIGKLKKIPVQTVKPTNYRLKLDLQLFADKKKDIHWDAQNPVFGDEWESYFKSQYGSENVSKNKKKGTGSARPIKPAQPRGEPIKFEPLIKQEKIAQQTYDKLKRTGLNMTELEKFSKNTGLSLQEATELKKHLFLTEHVNLPDAINGKYYYAGYFHPDMHIAYGWEKALQGELSTAEKAWFRQLANHELAESKMMQEGIPYRKIESWNPKEGLTGRPPHQGAHDLAPPPPKDFPDFKADETIL